MKIQTTTPLIGWIGDQLNFTLLEHDLNLIEKFNGYVGFSHDIVGFFKVYPLWNCKGNSIDGQYSNYEGMAHLTELGIQLSYLRKLIEDIFQLKYLKFARIFELRDGGFLLPHRDYLELKTGFTRIHLPLKTNLNSFNSNEIDVYHLRVGEIWLHNRNLVHSAINFSSESRLNLILDFDLLFQ